MRLDPKPNPRASHNGVRERKPLWYYWPLIEAFGQRDLKSKFKGSALGWLWSLLVPLATIGIYSVVFYFFLRIPPPDFGTGRPGIFAIWLFTGLIFWTFFQNTVNQGIVEMVAAGPVLQKVYFPAYAPVLGAGLAVGVQSLIELAILLVILALLGNVAWTWLLLPLFMVLAVIFVGSVATIFAVLNIYYRDTAHLVQVALQLLFYATPIIYPASMVNMQWRGIEIRSIMEINPLWSFVQLIRNLLYDLTPGSLTHWGIAGGASLAALGIAALVMRNKGADLGEHV